MKLLFDITHPAHVHLFRNAIEELETRGHEVRVTSREKEITTQLLDSYSINHETLSEAGNKSLAIEWVIREFRLLSFVRSFRPDAIVSRFNPAAAHVSTLIGCPYVMFEDTEKENNIITNLTYPIADMICTPMSFAYDLGENHVRYKGLHELAYLHPSWFEPNEEILKSHGVMPNETYSVLRFVGWDAHHDVDEEGLSLQTKRELVSRLSEHGSVYITSEEDLPTDLANYRLPIAPEHVHHLLYYADLLVGDSQTMTCEAGILGTPAIRSNSLASSKTDHARYLQELEEDYGLVYSTMDENLALDLAEDLITKSTNPMWNKKRQLLLEDKIDVTNFMLDVIDESISGKTI